MKLKVLCSNFLDLWLKLQMAQYATYHKHIQHRLAEYLGKKHHRLWELLWDFLQPFEDNQNHLCFQVSQTETKKIMIRKYFCFFIQALIFYLKSWTNEKIVKLCGWQLNIVSCSPDPTTNSETTNLDYFSTSFKQIRLFWQKHNYKLPKKKLNFKLPSFEIDCWIRSMNNLKSKEKLKICVTFVIPTPTTKTLRADFMIDGFTSWAILILLFFAQNVINLWHCTCPLNKYLKFLNEIRFKFPAIKVCTYLGIYKIDIVLSM